MQTAKINVLTYERQLAEATITWSCSWASRCRRTCPRRGRSTTRISLRRFRPGCLPTSFQRRPDILEAEHTLKAANAKWRGARRLLSHYQPDRLRGVEQFAIDQLFGAGTGMWSFSPQITVPIFTGGKNRADLDSARVGTRIEIANYEKAIQTAFREVADALVDRRDYRTTSHCNAP